MNSVPVPPRAAAANGQDSVVIFDGAKLNIVLVVFHNQRSGGFAYSNLRQELDGVALAYDPLVHDGCVNSGATAVVLRNRFQDGRCLFSGVRIEGYHHATAITLDDCDDHLRADPQ